MSAQGIIDVFREALTQIANEIIQVIPLIFFALIIISLTFLTVKIVDSLLKRVFKYAKIDSLFSNLTGFSLPFTITGLIIFLINLGIALIGAYVIINIFLGPQYITLMNEVLNYSARIISIIIISVILLATFNLLIGKIRFETRLRSYAMLIVLLLITAMLVDVTALSEPVKQALTTGLSLGVGISIGIFAFWFFFHDYLDKFFNKKTSEQAKETE